MEVTNWQDQIIHLKNVRKNWHAKKNKRKKGNADSLKKTDTSEETSEQSQDQPQDAKID